MKLGQPHTHAPPTSLPPELGLIDTTTVDLGRPRIQDPNKAISLAAKQEILRRQEEEPIRYVRFNNAVQRYANNWIDIQKIIILFLASNAIGKTYSTVTLLGWSMWPDLAPNWFRVPWEKKVAHHGIDSSFRLCSTPKELEEGGTIQKAILKLWPQNRYQAKKLRKPFMSYFETDSGWTGDVMSYEQPIEEFEGATKGIIVYNEPPTREIRKACVFRTRMGGMEAFPATPLNNAAWMKDDLVDQAPSRPEIAVSGGEMEDACKEHSKNGHLKHEKIEFLISEMDEDEKLARKSGQFMHLSGVILKSFTRNRFVPQEPLLSRPIYPHFMVVDPAGFNKPFSVIWGQVVPEPMHGIQILKEWPLTDPNDKKTWFENLKSPDNKVEDYVKIFREIENDLKIPPVYRKDMLRILDRRFGHVKDLRHGKSLRDHFGEYGFYFIDSYSVSAGIPEIKTGIQNIKDYLKLDPLTGKANILIDKSCFNLIRAIERWMLDPKTQKPKDDVWKNFCDVLRYVCSNRPQFYEMQSEEDWNGTKKPYYDFGGDYQ